MIDLHLSNRNFLTTVVRNEEVDVAMELYNTLVPHLYSPNLDTYKNLLIQIDAQRGHKHLPKLWTDLEASSFCGTNVITRMQFLERFALSMEYADLALFFDFDDPDDNEKRSLLKVKVLMYM